MVYGEYYNTSILRAEDGDPVYVKNYVVRQNDYVVGSFFHKKDADDFVKANAEKYNNLSIKGEYVIGDPKKNSKLIFDGEYCTFFPRMWNRESARIRYYKEWAGITEDFEYKNGQQVPRKPRLGENLRFSSATKWDICMAGILCGILLVDKLSIKVLEENNREHGFPESRLLTMHV